MRNTPRLTLILRREELGHSQKFIANKAGISFSTLSQIERGKQGVNVKQAILLANALQTTVEKLFKDEV
ncbi:helix-turn-helix transcriptional regulator [Exiguobacterium sp. S22-S28]|uniref:helix-turn-helix transcriptional regulator n=1 Tax=Exiguobacterium sp. S22-S28 TaxID=3342768 RepID=UPI00372D1C7C